MHQPWASARARAKAGHDHLIVAVTYHLLVMPCDTPGTTCEDDWKEFLLRDGQVPRSAVPLYLEPRLAVPCSCPPPAPHVPELPGPPVGGDMAELGRPPRLLPLRQVRAELAVQANGDYRVSRALDQIEKVNHPPEERSPRPHHLTCVVEEPDESLRVQALQSPHSSRVAWRCWIFSTGKRSPPSCPGVYLDCREDDACSGSLPLVDSHRDIKRPAHAVQDIIQALLALRRGWK